MEGCDQITHRPIPGCRKRVSDMTILILWYVILHISWIFSIFLHLVISNFFIHQTFGESQLHFRFSPNYEVFQLLHFLFLLTLVCVELDLPSWDKRCLVTSQDFNFLKSNFTWLFDFEIVSKLHKQLRIALNFRFFRLHPPRARIADTVHHAWFTQHWGWYSRSQAR